jgi:UPF0755 protein
LSATRPFLKVPGPRQRKKRGSAVSRVLLWTFLLCLAGGFVLIGAGIYAQSEYIAPGPLAKAQVFVVEPGQSASEIGTSLEQAGVVSNGLVFAAMANLTGQRNRLKAGEYRFARAATMQDVMGQIAGGKVITYKLSIPEGFTSEMAVERINTNDILTGPPVAVPPEGSLLPDTYVFRRGMTRQRLLENMQAAQRRLLEKLWENRVPVPAIETMEQAVTLASIVEKETAVPEERPVIASVFINRLNKGMRLQSDPTIIYGIVGGKGRLDRALTRSDIDTTTPYNTYRINGLPPGPIANPGRAALEAVLNPTPTEHLYFVADGTGGHAFAATLEEHNRNVRRWREIAGNAAAAAAADDGGENGGEGEAPATEQAAASEPGTTPVPVPAPGSTVVPLEAVTKSLEQQAPEAAPPAKPKVLALEPGTIVMVDGRQAVIPRLRPAR